ncbi:class IIb bacteriocin, lactobin A/cerein 7B family [Neisseria canis]|uniref:Class IIb bacteriocin, lactobin A/cerein 7B family n=1 Tax=Neisseria canis TaxID=493 RepID=A0A3S4P2P5_9NEIS|nr:class IIb bacteriocin, lactobin A/cerein 7B family [Neisseria canis]VEE98989.1 class IIb bacteriocin, lactobin A/cerein 7B family [Neisseria canis]
MNNMVELKSHELEYVNGGALPALVVWGLRIVGGVVVTGVAAYGGYKFARYFGQKH